MRFQTLLASLFTVAVVSTNALAQEEKAVDNYERFLTVVTDSYDHEVALRCPCPQATTNASSYRRFESCVKSVEVKVERMARDFVRKTPLLHLGSTGSLTVKDALAMRRKNHLYSCIPR